MALPVLAAVVDAAYSLAARSLWLKWQSLQQATVYR